MARYIATYHKTPDYFTPLTGDDLKKGRVEHKVEFNQTSDERALDYADSTEFRKVHGRLFRVERLHLVFGTETNTVD